MELGATRSVIGHRLATGRWEACHPGVYRVAAAPQTHRQCLMAAVLWAGDGSAVSHLAAAGLYHLPAGRLSTPELSVPPGCHCRQTGIVVHRPGSLPTVDIIRVDRIPVTTVARTIIDLAGVLPVEVVEETLDFALSHGYVPRVRLEWRVRELASKGRPGIGMIRSLLEARGPGQKLPDSILETKLGRILGPLHPVWGHVVVIDGRVYVLDCAFPEHLLAVEADGWATHCGRLQREEDIARQNALVRAGWTVLRYPWSVIVGRPDMVLGDVTQTMARIV